MSKELLAHLDGQFDRLNEKITEVREVQVRQAAALEEHMRRTAAAEENLELLRKESRSDTAELRKEFEPVKTHVKAVGLLGKMIGVAGAAVGLVLGLLKLFG